MTKKRFLIYFYICDLKTDIMTGRYAIVTGGSSGMGLEYVRQLGARGYNVIIVALRQEETDAVKAEMDNSFPDLDFVSIGMDLAAPDSADILYTKVKKLRPEAMVEVLVNNAGIMCAKFFKSMNSREVNAILMLHNYTLTQLCGLYLPEMLERRRGYILNVSSLGVWFAYPLLTTYSSTKAYTRTFTKALRMECRGTGVNVATIYFGAVNTPLLPISDRIRNLAMTLHAMMAPEKAVRIALGMLFSGHSGKIPGVMNKVWFYFVRYLVPAPLICHVTRKISEKFQLS